ncbi:thioredoxin family protein [Natronogracilivirga saccharolytica]|uniref:TM0996/MTH895 family glutaredoxin-like protein n=1 Tax=Natronogracilivirga saccharolytica TaxID=2812953 RepID=A0A8J7RKC3_9BACT|nr:thioredoxin family protein [Natronogracilivirga saccharolytica]MBP3193315.1 TM0996/MTH895 family glutaredoxin-like protein [Natronogracilivirga saccharolytica]
MKVQIAGPGCPKCQTTEKTVKEALAELNRDAEVIHVTDYQEMARLGVRITPAVVIDGKIALAGRVPSLEEAKDLLQSG